MSIHPTLSVLKLLDALGLRQKHFWLVSIFFRTFFEVLKMTTYTCQFDFTFPEQIRIEIPHGAPLRIRNMPQASRYQHGGFNIRKGDNAYSVQELTQTINLLEEVLDVA